MKQTLHRARSTKSGPTSTQRGSFTRYILIVDFVYDNIASCVHFIFDHISYIKSKSFGSVHNHKMHVKTSENTEESDDENTFSNTRAVAVDASCPASYFKLW